MKNILYQPSSPAYCISSNFEEQMDNSERKICQTALMQMAMEKALVKDGEMFKNTNELKEFLKFFKVQINIIQFNKNKLNKIN